MNINSVESLTNNFINQENKGVKSSDNTLNTGAELYASFSSSDFLYNQLTVRLYRTAPALTFYDIEIKIRDTTTSTGSELLSTHIIQGERVVVRTFTFNPSHDIEYYFKNNGADNIKIDFIFSFSELDQPYILSFDSTVGVSTAITRQFTKFNGLINRMRILLRSSGTLDATITLTHRSNSASMIDELVNFTVNTGSLYSEFYDFNPCSKFDLLIQNNDGSNSLTFQIIIFFSTNLEPQLNEHIETSNIHFLENTINLANLSEKNHSSLTDDQITKHRLINDAGSSTTELFSASKVIADLLLKAGVGHNHSGVYEPAFSNTTGFNKNYGTIAGTVSQGNHAHTTYYTQAQVNAFLAIGTANKRYCQLIESSGYISEYYRMDYSLANWYNRDANDSAWFMECPLPPKLGTKNLYVDYVYVYLYDADSSDYLNDLKVYGKNTNSTTTLYQSTTNQTTTGLKSYSTGADPWGLYKRVVVGINFIGTTGQQFEVSTIYVRYWYQ